MANTPFERMWDQHVIKDYGDGRALIDIDRHFAQEGTSGGGSTDCGNAV